MLTRLAHWFDGQLHAEDRLTLFPALVWPEGNGWKWTLRGTVFRPAARPIVSYFFRRALGLDGLKLSPEEAALFRQRSAPFLADRERGKSLHLRVGGTEFHFDPTAPHGHFHGTFPVNPSSLIQEDRCPERRTFDLMVRLGTQRLEKELSVPVHFLDGTGLDIITDVDDTIKVTNVRDKSEAARNTFLRPFQPVAGLAGRLAGWAAAHQSQVHYITGSPWQLYGALEEFARVQGFPSGTWAMQVFRIKDRTALHLIRKPEIHKRAALQTLLARATQRRFVCVGDSGERDPEIYGDIAREFPGRIHRIFIRDVTGDPGSCPRYATAFAGLDPDTIQVFRDATELPALLCPEDAPRLVG